MVHFACISVQHLSDLLLKAFSALIYKRLTDIQIRRYHTAAVALCSIQLCTGEIIAFAHGFHPKATFFHRFVCVKYGKIPIFRPCAVVHHQWLTLCVHNFACAHRAFLPVAKPPLKLLAPCNIRQRCVDVCLLLVYTMDEAIETVYAPGELDPGSK